MKSQKILVWLNHGCYPGHTMFSCGFSYDELLTLIKRKGVSAYEWREIVEEFENDLKVKKWLACYLKNEKGNFYLLIFLRDKFTFTDIEYVALAHEVTHICQYLLPDILDRNREKEAEAYFHSHLMEQALRNLRLKPKQKSKPKHNETNTQPTD